MIKKSIVYLVFSFISYFSFSQIQVDPFTGSASASIPITTVQSTELSFPIQAQYRSGVKYNANTGNLGTGWQLIVEGSISRQVNDLPDDYYKDSSVKKVGWIHEDGGVTPASYVNTYIPDGDYLSCSNDDAEFDVLSKFGGFADQTSVWDTQPDIYRINVPGHIGGSFIFDHNGNPEQIGGEDLDIKIESQDNDGLITGFSVKSPDQTMYFFEPIVFETKTVTKTATGDVIYAPREYFVGSVVKYCIEWKLVRIQTATGDWMSFNYDLYEPAYTSVLTGDLENTSFTWGHNVESQVDAYVYSPNSDAFVKQEQYTVKKTYTSYLQTLQRIETNLEVVDVLESHLVLPKGTYNFFGAQVRGLIKYNKEGDEKYRIDFNFKTVLDSIVDPSTQAVDYVGTHLFLNSISIRAGAINRLLADFEYYSVDESPSLTKDGTNERIFSSILTDRSEMAKDVFGYYAPVNTELSDLSRTFPTVHYYDGDGFKYHVNDGTNSPDFTIKGITNHDPDLLRLTAGNLKRITFERGGSQEVQYEPNMYYDASSQVNRYGGGVRVKKLITFDGISHDHDQITTYDYQSGLNSSGVLLWVPNLVKPVQVFTNPDDGTQTYYHELLNNFSGTDLIKRSHIVFDREYSMYDGPSVGYSAFSEIKEGIGKSIYEMSIPITWDTQAYEYWNSTNLLTASPTYTSLPDVYTFDGCYTLGEASFKTEHMLRDYYAGLFNGELTKTSVYDDGDNLVSVTEYEYVNRGSGASISVLDSEYTSRMLKYELAQPLQIEDVIVPLMLAKKDQIYIDKFRRRSKVTTKKYEGSQFVTSTTDFAYTTKHQVKNKVVKQMGEEILTTSHTYPYEYGLESLNFSDLDDAGKAVFQLNEFKQWIPVETITTIPGSTETRIISANATIPTYIEPILGEGINYVLNKEKDISQYSFLDFINNQLQLDTDMEVATSAVSHVNVKKLPNATLSSLSNEIIKNGIHIDENTGWPLLTIGNAYAEEVLFNTFDYEGTNELSFNTSKLVAGRLSNDQGYELDTGDNLNGSLDNDGYDQYVISAWVKSNTAGNLSVSIDGGTANNIVSFDNSNEWKYYEALVDLTPGANHQFELTTSTQISIDEVLIYPEIASIAYNQYNNDGEVICTTNSMGQSSYYEYDSYGRIQIERDKDNNITKSYSYTTLNSTLGGFTSIDYDKVYVSTTNTSFPVEFRKASYSVDFDGGYKWQIVKKSNYDPAVFTVYGTGESVTYTFMDKEEYVIRMRAYYNVDDYYETITYVTPRDPDLLIELDSDKSSVVDLCDANHGDVTLTITDVTGGSGNYSYQWQLYNPAVPAKYFDLTYSGSSTNTVTIPEADYLHNTYLCIVTDNEFGHSIGSRMITFTTYQSTPGCPNGYSE